MQQDAVLSLFRSVGALLEGHFRLSSGLHSNGYMQSALVLQHPGLRPKCLGRALAGEVRRDRSPTAVLSPALGGLDHRPHHGRQRPLGRPAHLPRVDGHRAGIASVRDVVETSARLGIPVLTLYAFSIENWKRPRSEVSALMMLLRRYLRSELHMLLEHGIRFKVVGRRDALSPRSRRARRR